MWDRAKELVKLALSTMNYDIESPVIQQSNLVDFSQYFIFLCFSNRSLVNFEKIFIGAVSQIALNSKSIVILLEVAY